VNIEFVLPQKERPAGTPAAEELDRGSGNAEPLMPNLAGWAGCPTSHHKNDRNPFFAGRQVGGAKRHDSPPCG